MTVSIPMLQNKLSGCVSNLMRWNKYTFAHIKTRLSECYRILSELQSTPPTIANIQKINGVEREINSLLEKEECKWRQRSRVSWLRAGDHNT